MGGFPRSKVAGKLQSIIGRKTRPYTVKRPSKNINAVGEVEDTASTHQADLYIYQNSERSVQLPMGETTGSGPTGLALPSADLQDGDRVEYGGDTYEMTVAEVPAEGDTQVLRCSLDRVVD